MFNPFPFNRRNQSAVLLVDGALSPKMIIVFRNFKHPFARNISAAEYIFQERQNVLRLIGTTEGHDDQSIGRLGHTKERLRTDGPALDNALAHRQLKTKMTPTGLEPVLPA